MGHLGARRGGLAWIVSMIDGQSGAVYSDIGRGPWEWERDGTDFYLVKWRCAELKQAEAVTPNECSSCC